MSEENEEVESEVTGTPLPEVGTPPEGTGHAPELSTATCSNCDGEKFCSVCSSKEVV